MPIVCKSNIYTYILMRTIITEQQIATKWEALVRKYREEYKKINIYCPSGSSAATVKSSNWPLYSQMGFLEVHIQHRKSLSSSSTLPPNLEESQQQQQQSSSQSGPSQQPPATPSTSQIPSSSSLPSLNKNRFKRTRKADELDQLKLLFNENRKACDNLVKFQNETEKNETEKNACAIPPQNAGVKNYSLLLREGFKRIPNDYKFDCCADITQYIQDFKDNH